MTKGFADITFTPAVAALQELHGSREAYARVAERASSDALGPEERAFVRARDSFYMATVSETGWPYIQHRGGPKGFLRVLDERTIGFTDFEGNKQYISLGNLSRNERVALFLMDYPARTRLKILARAKVVESDGRREIVLSVEGFDWNCRQHITPRYTLDEMGAHAGS
jgi:predicted pyridoxine 5'-phosphate oxidase superfamily flavin-nucleotide-binding protein